MMSPSTKTAKENREVVKPTSALSNAKSSKGSSSKKAILPLPGSDEKSKSKPSTSKHNIQVVYKPPFSVKVEMISPGESSKSPASSSRTSGDSKPKTSPTTAASSSSPSGSSGSAKPRVSTSLLRRRKSKASSKYPKSIGKSELQILIPRTNEEDDSVTPQPLTS